MKRRILNSFIIFFALAITYILGNLQIENGVVIFCLILFATAFYFQFNIYGNRNISDGVEINKITSNQ